MGLPLLVSMRVIRLRTLGSNQSGSAPIFGGSPSGTLFILCRKALEAAQVFFLRRLIDPRGGGLPARAMR